MRRAANIAACVLALLVVLALVMARDAWAFGAPTGRGGSVEGVSISPTSVTASGGVPQFSCSATDAVCELRSSTADGTTSGTVPAIRMKAGADITATDLIFSVEDSSGNRRLSVPEGDVIQLNGFTSAASSTLTNGANLSLSGGGTSNGILTAGNATGDRGLFVNKIGASAASSTVAAFRFDHNNGALGANDAHTIWSDNNSGTELGKLDAEGDLTVAGTMKAGSTATRGTITLSTGTGTATVLSGAFCTCVDTTAPGVVQCAVSSTTLTATAGAGAGATDVIAYVCL